MLRRPGRKETVRIVSVALIILFLISCAKKEALKFQPYPVPERVTESHLLQRITYDHISSLSTSTQIRVFQEDEFTSYFTGAMNYVSPNSLAISFFGPFGVTVMRVLISDGILWIYLPNKDTLYTSMVEIPFLLPTSELLRTFDTDLSANDDGYMLDLYRSGENNNSLTARYYFESKTLWNHTIEKYNQNRLVFSIEIRDTSEDNVPTDFSLSIGKNRFDIRTGDLAINPEIPQEVFSPISASRILPIQDFLRSLAPNQ